MGKILRLVVLLALPASAWATETAAFLKIGVGARALAMGGAYTAVADGVGAVAWNPAGLAGLTKRELGATHTELTTDTRFDFVGFAQPVKHGVLAVAGTYLSQGRIQGRDVNGAPTGGYSAADQSAALGFASKVLPDLDLGASAKYIRSSIADASGQSAALDLGGRYVLNGFGGPGVPVIGAAVQNLGPAMKFLDQSSQLPLTLTAGIGYRWPAGSILALDYKGRPYSRDSEFSVGAEYAVLSNFALRAGYATAKPSAGDQAVLAALNGFSMGFGIKLRAYSLDYSFTPAGELGSVQTLSLGARF